MIASPGDVSSERAIIRDVIYEWNAVHSYSRNIVLLPTGWETHSSPETGDSAQNIINRQILERCDLLVGVFWTRIGSATESHLSGTVEEIERHIESGGPAMLYFSSQPAALDSVDPEQYANLSSFKRSCQNRSLYQSYDSQSDFKNKFYRHLQLKLNEHAMFQLSDTASSEETVRELAYQLPELSEEARVLLKEASLDPHGTIMHIRFLGGAALQTNNKNLMESNNRRDVAKWEAALDQLQLEGLIVARGFKNEVFAITNQGYQVADMIAL